jgi:hypothetical protein
MATKRGILLLRAILVGVLRLCLWNAGQAKADDVVYLVVPLARDGHDVPVAFLDRARTWCFCWTHSMPATPSETG